MSRPPTAIPLSPDLDDTIGPMLIGTLFSMTLWGITCSQAYDYFGNNMDGRLQRSIVALLWMLDTLSSVMHAHLIYFYLVTCFVNPSKLLNASWSINSHSLVAAVSSFIIRSMFARRIYQFSQKNIIVPAWIIIISTCDLVIATITASKAFQGVNPVALHNISKFLYISFALGVTADLSVTIALSWLLQSVKSGFRSTDSIVNTLMAYVVNTGLLVTVIATVGLITYIVMPNKLFFIAFSILAGKLYLNAYLATLNARVRLRMTPDSGVPISLGVPNPQGRDTQGIALTSSEKTEPVRNPTMSNLFQKTVEQRVDDIDEARHSPSSV